MLYVERNIKNKVARLCMGLSLIFCINFYVNAQNIPCQTPTPKIIPYTGCVNLGMRDTIALKVEQNSDINSYEWSLPDTWSILGCDTCATINVITHDFKKQAQHYSVIGKNDCALPSEKALDSIWIKGTDTTMVIRDISKILYVVRFPPNISVLHSTNYYFRWYKDSIGTIIYMGPNVPHINISLPSNPVLQYKRKDSECWSVAKNVYIPKAKDTISICSGDSTLWRGTFYKDAGNYAYEDRSHYDCVDTIYKDSLHLKVYPSYLDTSIVSIEQDELPYIVGKDTIRSFGLHTLYSGTSINGCDSIKYLKLGLPCQTATPKIIPYTGCVNLGMQDTIALKVEQNSDISSYEWSLPDTWSILGCDTCATIKVITHDFKKQAQHYSVIGKSDCALPSEKALDSIWIKGTDTTMVIGNIGVMKFVARFSPNQEITPLGDYVFLWHKDSVNEPIVGVVSIPQNKILPSNPVLQYRHIDSECWSVAKNVYIPKAKDTISICSGDSTLWRGTYYNDAGNYAYEDRLHYDCVDTIYKDSLHLKVYPSYHDTSIVSIEQNELPYIVGKDTIRSFGLHTLYSGTSIDGCDSIKYLKLGLPCQAPTPKIIPYTGCVNLGMRDTIALKVEQNGDINSYEWSLPDTWSILGCDTCATIKVITHDFKKQAQHYSVIGKSDCALPSEKALDSIWIKGTDTTMVINAAGTLIFVAKFYPNTSIYATGDYFLLWFKDSIIDMPIRNNFNIAQSLIRPSNPVLLYRHIDSECWSVAKNVYIPKAKDTISICSGDSTLWRGTYYKEAGNYAYEDRIHYDCVDTIYKDSLHIKVHPSYRDTSIVSIEQNELPYIVGKDTIRSFGLHTLYSGTSIDGCDSIKYLKLGLPCQTPTPKIIPYTGCVNLGMRDTIALKVEQNSDISSYEWSLPDTWSILGCDTCATINVITHDFKKQAQHYSVIGKNDCALPSEKALDSIWIKGTDTTMVINTISTLAFVVRFSPDIVINQSGNYSFLWYRDSIGNPIGSAMTISQNKILPSNPVLQYRHIDSECWSVAKNVYIPKAKDTISICSGDSTLWRGTYYKEAGNYAYEDRIHYDCVDTIYKDSLHIKVHPSYHDTNFVSIEQNELPYIVGKDTIRSFGLHTLYSGKSIDGCDSIKYLKLGLPCQTPTPKIIPYTGCVNLGMRDTIALKVEQNSDISSYEWSLPDTWSILGCDTCATVNVITHDFKKQAQHYSVIGKNDCALPSEKALDSIWIKGTDTTMVIRDIGIRQYIACFHPNIHIVVEPSYSGFWHKDSIGVDYIGRGMAISQISIRPSNPVLQYRHIDSECWSVAKNVYIPKAKDTISICSGDSTLWRGNYYKDAGNYAYEDRFHYDCVDTIYKDSLHLKVYPSYLDTSIVSIEQDELPYIVGKDTIRSFGLHTLYSGTSINGCDSIKYLKLGLPCQTATPKIIPYTGCVNLGMRDTIALKVEQNRDINSYEWSLPDTWSILGCDTCATINVITHDFKKQAQHYSVIGKSDCALPSEKALDSIWIKGTDTTMAISAMATVSFMARFFPNKAIEQSGNYSFLWHKDSIGTPISNIMSVAQSIIRPSNPVLQYKRRDSECWSVAKNVYIPKAKDTISICSGDSTLWRGTYYKDAGNYAYEDRIHYDCVDTIYKDSLHLKVHPSYHDTNFVSIERDSLPYIAGQDTIRSFGLHTLYSGTSINGCDSIKYFKLDTLYVRRSISFFDTLSACHGDSLLWRGQYYKTTGVYTDSLIDPYKGGTDSIYHLDLSLHPTYYFAFADSCHKDSLPYISHGHTFTDFGEKKLIFITDKGCDSIVQINLKPFTYSYTVNVSTSQGGSANIDGDTTLTEGHSISLFFYPEPCYKLDSLFIDGKRIKTASSYRIENISKDYDIRAVFSIHHLRSDVAFVLCPYELPLLYNGKSYTTGDYQILLNSSQGCDSTVFLSVKPKQNISHLDIVDSIPPLCGVAPIKIDYRKISGDPKNVHILFSQKAIEQGFLDTVVAITITDSPYTAYKSIKIPVPSSSEPNKYSLQVRYADSSGCFTEEENIDFEVRYPETIIQQKWDDLLAVKAPNFNGGYTFSAYQWFCDGIEIVGATKSYYYQKSWLNRKSDYSVLLTRVSDGLTMFSCPVKRLSPPKNLKLSLHPNPSAENNETTIAIEGNENTLYSLFIINAFGKQIYKSNMPRGWHKIPVLPPPGIYIIRVENINLNESQYIKWIVR